MTTQRGRLALARMGIAVRLGLAFAVVAVLAVTANLIAERGVSIVQTETIERAQPAPPNPRPVRPRTVAPPAASLPSPAPMDPDRLLTAIGRYDRAIERRAELPGPDAATHVAAAAEDLQTEVRRFVAVAAENSAPPPDVARLGTQLSAHHQLGQDLVRAADRRRELFSAYWDRFERVDAQVKASLDRNWKIFGRVIARQSLIALGRDLDDIRRHWARLSPAGPFDAATLEALAGTETRFATALESNARGLGRSQGAQWLQGLRADFAEVIAARVALVAADEHARRLDRTLEQRSAQIARTVRAIATVPAVAVAPVLPAPTPHPTTAAETPAAPAAPPATRTSRITTSSVPGLQSQRLVIALVSGAVLVLLLLISIGTVRSIVTPIRRFIQTTTRLASGDIHARVPRGGIRELDLLAVAFNEMASSLAAARTQMREYQAQLEERVDERTRQLQHLAEHDPLTGLPNRRQLVSYLQAALRRAGRAGTQVGVFFLDLDNFKNINDSMGHAFGDRVLTAIGQRLREATHLAGFAARLGGDEFTVIYEGADSVEDVCRVGGQLVCAFQKPLLIDGRELQIGVSVGASVYPDHERDGDALLQAADAALFQSKTSGRSQLSLFNPAMLEAATLKFRIEQGLRRAVDRGEFELLFQPEVSFDSLDTQLVEALLRWRLPDGRHVSPTEFLTVAEESGLIVNISDWVLRSAIEYAARWHRDGWNTVRVAINVSARQLLDARFVDRVWELMKQHHLPAHCIEIELTETVLQTGPATIETLRRLRELGVAIALDDFGTGYSSLASLEQLPLTRVKLDRSLIASIHTSERSLAIARAIVGLCRSLGLAVTAEGIENAEQLAVLLELPSLCLQGYLIAQPVAGERVPAVVADMPQRLQSLLLTLPSDARPRLQPVAALPLIAAERA